MFVPSVQSRVLGREGQNTCGLSQDVQTTDQLLPYLSLPWTGFSLDHCN